MEEKIRDFKDLRIWQKGMDLVEEIYKVTPSFPKSEVYGLASQMQRSSVSIPSNIAEGFRRRHNKEYKQFLNIALGSCGELETQIEIARRLGYITDDQSKILIQSQDYICRMIQTLIKKLGQ